MLIPYGYNGDQIPLEQLDSRQTWRGLHPEFRRRVHAMLVEGDGRLGIGQGWRSSAVQEATFLQRHTPVTSGGCCVYNGQRYALKPGNAHAAPPGLSFHESQTVDGGSWAMAADMIGDLAWMEPQLARFGLKSFANLTGAQREPWHIQLLELPNSVTAWKAAGSPSPNRPAPSRPEPAEPAHVEEDDMPAPAIAAIYRPTPTVRAARPENKHFALLPDGSVRHASGPDVDLAIDDLKVPVKDIKGTDHYDQLAALADQWRA